MSGFKMVGEYHQDVNALLKRVEEEKEDADQLRAERDGLVAEVEQKQSIIDHQTEMLSNYFADVAWRHFMNACIKRKVSPSMFDDFCAAGAIRDSLREKALRGEVEG